MSLFNVKLLSLVLVYMLIYRSIIKTFIGRFPEECKQSGSVVLSKHCLFERSDITASWLTNGMRLGWDYQSKDEVSYTHQGCIYLIQNTVKIFNIIAI